MLELSAQGFEIPTVCDRRDTKHDVHRTERGKQIEPHEFAKASFQSIAIDRRVLVARDDEPDARERGKGSGGAHVH